MHVLWQRAVSVRLKADSVFLKYAHQAEPDAHIFLLFRQFQLLEPFSDAAETQCYHKQKDEEKEHTSGKPCWNAVCLEKKV